VNDLAVNRTAWQRHAHHRQATGDRPATLLARFDWTQLPGLGPGVKLFGPVQGLRVVELGCGAGDHTAYLAAHGAHATGIDFAPAQIHRAGARWRQTVPGATFVADEAIQFLGRDSSPLDACFSIFGALGHCEPAPLLRAIHRRLRPRGRLLFSVRHPTGHARSVLSSGRRIERLRIGRAIHVPIVRYDHDLETWTSLLTAAGYSVHTALELVPPQKPPCCLLFAASPAIESSCHRSRSLPCDEREP
jgi:SAM-dependent methyltransferase